jgi:hypothetical protein
MATKTATMKPTPTNDSQVPVHVGYTDERRQLRGMMLATVAAGILTRLNRGAGQLAAEAAVIVNALEQEL